MNDRLSAPQDSVLGLERIQSKTCATKDNNQ